MEMGIHEGRGNELAGHVDDLTGSGRQPRLHGHDATIADADVDAGAAIGQGALAQDQVEHGITPRCMI
jgi:hypothetical protein